MFKNNCNSKYPSYNVRVTHITTAIIFVHNGQILECW